MTKMFGKILVGSDGSSGAKNAVKIAIDLAAKYESKLAIISIIEGRPKFATSISEAKMIEEREREHFEEIHHAAQLQAAKRGGDLATTIVPGHEITTLVEYARKEQFDLLVIGKQGHSSKGKSARVRRRVRWRKKRLVQS